VSQGLRREQQGAVFFGNGDGCRGVAQKVQEGKRRFAAAEMGQECNDVVPAREGGVREEPEQDGNASYAHLLPGDLCRHAVDIGRPQGADDLFLEGRGDRVGPRRDQQREERQTQGQDPTADRETPGGRPVDMSHAVRLRTAGAGDATLMPG
jgi:hypothetical protein